MKHIHRISLICLTFLILEQSNMNAEETNKNVTDTSSKETTDDKKTNTKDAQAKDSTVDTKSSENKSDSSSSTSSSTPSTSTSETNKTSSETKSDTSSTTTSSSSANSTPPAVPQATKAKTKVLTSIYIQNNYKKDGVLKSIEILITGQTNPVKKELNITIPANKNLYSKGTVTAFDLTTENDVKSFQGIASITLDGDQIKFTTPRTGFSLSNPITISKKDDHWVLDEQTK